MYINRALRRNGRWYRLTFFGKSTQGPEDKGSKVRRYPGTIKLTACEGERDRMQNGSLERLDCQPNEAAVAALDALEWHGYVQIASCIEKMQLDEACKIVGILKDVGII